VARRRVVLDPERCTGHGRCYDLAPELFDADERGHCVVVVADPSDAQVERARLAVESCPEQALALIDG
jgi:ferredoxin